ncbi:MBL fold metallo-hydrolase [Bradyrhizobium sp. 6(2017)]|uniref:MBL fold metallo-hydrolase n=2 Tax=unclassified Bradyrhizobium TaxID=2631580 RepID=UPI0013E1413D|nr:MBL fold metallo-hydrolase [Bradyrhizobium sp. 6(2017)]QIG94910.1 MBL fold metallo-hydrolase [Bradyrhizobium sp. 6(2017)]
MSKTLASFVGLLAFLLGATVNAQTKADSDFKVTLLGTGTPIPDLDRFGPSTLVEAGNQKLLFDAGRGATIRLRQINATKSTIMSRIDALFITHYHSDHTLGIPDLWLTGWLGNSRKEPFRLIGPVGAKSLMSNLESAYALDIKIRLEDEKLSPEGIATVVEEFDKDGVVYDKDGVKVIAFTVDHGAAIKPAVGYRIEYKGHAVVISGDTRYDRNVIKYGTGVDLLIHEVCVVRPELLSNAYIQRVVDHHTSPREAGQIFSLAKPKLAVYSHLVFLGSDKVPRATVDDIVAGTRETYDGPLQVGEDLMSFEIGDTVTVRQRNP